MASAESDLNRNWTLFRAPMSFIDMETYTAPDEPRHAIPHRFVQRHREVWQAVQDLEDDILGWLEATNQNTPESW